MSYHPFDELEFFIRDKVILSIDAEYHAFTIWCAFALAIEEFDFSPRLAIWSPEKRCGKTTALELIHNLLPNSKLTSNITASALFRTIEKDETCAILIDESDTIFGRFADKEKAEALRGIGNTGFKRGSVVTRTEGKNFEPRDFHVFCPVAIAGIGTSAIPETIADRSIVIEMRRKLAHERISEYESDEIEEVFGAIRASLMIWVEENKQYFRKTRPEFPDSLNARARDVWKPMLKIAENIDEEWRNKIYNAALALSVKKEDPDDISLQLRLLMDCREVVTADLPTKDLIFRLRSLEESPWATMEKFNASTLAKFLRSYGIRSKQWTTHRGYTKASFEDAWKRYLPSPPAIPAIPVIGVTSVIERQPIDDAYDAYDASQRTSQQTIQNHA